MVIKNILYAISRFLWPVKRTDMTVSLRYGFSFQVISDDEFFLWPRIVPSGYYNELMRFLEYLGTSQTQSVIDDINSMDFSNRTPNELIEDEQWGDNPLMIYANPDRVFFHNDGHPFYVPVSDFIAILEEWKNFLNSIRGPHFLSGR